MSGDLSDEAIEDFMLRHLGRLLKSSMPTVRMSARINRKLYAEVMKLREGKEKGKWQRKVEK